MKPLKEYLSEITIPQIDDNNTKGFPDTQKRQHIVNTVNIGNIKFIPFIPSNALQVSCDSHSNGHHYKTSIAFDAVQYQEEADQNTVEIHGTDNAVHNMIPVSMQQDHIKIDCTCADFRFRFAQQHFKNKSLVGNPPPAHIATTDRPPVNPMNVLGACKHVLALVDKIRIMRIVR